MHNLEILAQLKQGAKPTPTPTTMVISTLRHGSGSFMVWGAVAASGVGNMFFIVGITDHFRYKTILEHNLKVSLERIGCCIMLPDNFVYHHKART